MVYVAYICVYTHIYGMCVVCMCVVCMCVWYMLYVMFVRYMCVVHVHVWCVCVAWVGFVCVWRECVPIGHGAYI